jgi:hypothetical protein
MDLEALKKLPREVQIVLGGVALYVIFSFFDWQSVFGYSDNEWHGLGVLAVLVAIVLLAWEISRFMNININLPLTPAQVSAGLALLLLVLTVIIFLDWSQYRAFGEWAGLLLSLVIAGAAFVRAKSEGVTMPEMPKNISVGSSSGGSMSAPPPPPPASGDSPSGSDSADA